MFYLDNHEDKEEIIRESKLALSRLVTHLVFVHQLTQLQSVALLQDLLEQLEEN
jgi:hypothetical protein